jgi:hypothetical protein
VDGGLVGVLRVWICVSCLPWSASEKARFIELLWKGASVVREVRSLEVGAREERRVCARYDIVDRLSG